MKKEIFAFTVFTLALSAHSLAAPRSCSGAFIRSYEMTQAYEDYLRKTYFTTTGYNPQNPRDVGMVEMLIGLEADNLKQRQITAEEAMAAHKARSQQQAERNSAPDTANPKASEKQPEETAWVAAPVKIPLSQTLSLSALAQSKFAFDFRAGPSRAQFLETLERIRKFIQGHDARTQAAIIHGIFTTGRFTQDLTSDLSALSGSIGSYPPEFRLAIIEGGLGSKATVRDLNARAQELLQATAGFSPEIQMATLRGALASSMPVASLVRRIAELKQIYAHDQKDIMIAAGIEGGIDSSRTPKEIAVYMDACVMFRLEALRQPNYDMGELLTMIRGGLRNGLSPRDAFARVIPL